MDLATMRATFRRHTSGLTDALTDADVDGYLNNIYAEFLPGEIDGKIHEVTWVQTLTADVNPITLPNRIVGFPSGRLWIQGNAGVRTGTVHYLTFYDNLGDFLISYPDYLDATNRARPKAVLRQGRSLYFDAFPDSDYNLIADARGCPEAALTTAGLPFNHAMAVVTCAAWNFLLEQEDEVGIMREATQYETWKERLLVEGHSDYHGRTPNRSF